MGTDRKAVVDPRTMKLKDFDGLFVVDSSVMPQATAGDLNTPTLMVAERAADLIKGKVLSEDAFAPIMGDFYWRERQRSSEIKHDFSSNRKDLRRLLQKTNVL